MDLNIEISRTPPEAAANRSYDCGTPTMYAFDCALCEQDSDMGFAYTAVNYLTGRGEVVAKRKNAFELRHEAQMAELIRNSRVAGYGRFQISRPVGQSLPLPKAKEILRHIFTDILPNHGYTVREGQIELAEHILEALTRGEPSLVEAGTGFGKSEAYLIPLFIVKLGRMNDGRSLSFYPEMQYADMSKLTAVISTASIALQKAIVRTYIPKLSRMLLENGIITAPLGCLLRKGREHYACRRNLKHHLIFVNDPSTRRQLEQLLEPNASIDLADAEGLSPFLKQKIGVPVRCPDNCKFRGGCRFLAMREQASTFFYDIQVTNHQMLLADTISRANRRTPLLPNYQLVVFDEAHKLADAARSLYGTELSDQSAKETMDFIATEKWGREGTRKLALKEAKKLRSVSEKLFAALRSEQKQSTDTDGERQTVIVDDETARQLTNYRDITERLITVLRDEIFGAKANAALKWVRERYKVNVSGVDAKRILAERAESDATRERQNKLHRQQAVRLHQAICRLPGVVKHIQNEQANRREPRFGMNPERYVLQQEYSSVKDTVWRQIEKTMLSDGARRKGCEQISSLIWDLEQLRERVGQLAKRDEHIYWLERGDGETLLRATPKNLPGRLYADQWKKNIPTVFTSGTLSAGGDFARTKQTLGLDKLGGRVTSISKQSPYDYGNNCLIYLPESIPFPEPENERYIEAVTDEAERLIRISNGHAAVLFTSYYVMGVVHNKLKQRGLPFTLFRLEKSTSNAIERFKNSYAETGKHGVLFAGGALWEGIDIPGDALSMLIIVKLPFRIPDAIGEYEQTQYMDFRTYLNSALVPEMLIKLKQGFGRLIRMETDTGCVAILDSRVSLGLPRNEVSWEDGKQRNGADARTCEGVAEWSLRGQGGAYRSRVLSALPGCCVTADLSEVEEFFKAKKQSDYFI
jgi:Rad3-related DNA helicase